MTEIPNFKLDFFFSLSLFSVPLKIRPPRSMHLDQYQQKTFKLMILSQPLLSPSPGTYASIR